MDGAEKEIETQESVADPAITESGGDPTPEERIAQLERELANVRDQFVRQVAEFQNYRRRTDQEKGQMAEFGKTMVIQQLLDVVDDFKRSLDAAEKVGDAPDPAALPDAFRSLHTGVAMVYGKLLGELAKLGVEQIDAVGQPFDEDLHEALMSQPAAEGEEPGQVVSEIQTGYRMGERVIRHARVVVTA